MKTDRSSIAGKRVLVVEEEYPLAVDLQHQLQQLGAQVVGPVPDALRALTLLEEGAMIDAAVLDVNLGNPSTDPLIEVLEERNVPIALAIGFQEGLIPLRLKAKANVETVMGPTELVPAPLQLAS